MGNKLLCNKLASYSSYLLVTCIIHGLLIFNQNVIKYIDHKTVSHVLFIFYVFLLISEMGKERKTKIETSMMGVTDGLYTEN